MRTKTKGLMSGMICLMAICLLAVGLFVAAPGRGAATAYAASSDYGIARISNTKTLTAHFAYTEYYHVNTSKTVQGSSADTTSALLPTSSGSRSQISFTITATSGYTSEFPIDGYVGMGDVTVTVSTGTIYVQDSSGSNLAQGTKSCTVSGLKENEKYTVRSSGGYGWLVSGRQYNQMTYVCSFTFMVDGNAPTISGASTSTTEKKTNQTFTVSAQDSGSGLNALYMKSPNGSYVSVGSSTTVNRGSTNGRYSFYAEDNAGNTSATYYVNFDDTAPVMECKGTNFGLSTNSPFTVTTTDNSGSATLYYKFNEGEWKASGSSYTLASASEDGSYSFYAQDSYGNKTDVRTIQVGADLYGEFVKSDKDNSVYFTWERSNWTATLDGKPYAKGTWIRSEGEHTVKLYSGTKNAVYPYTIDHYYVEKLVDATCTKSGFIEYDCLQCGNVYTVAAAEETGHYYVASTVAPTCTDGGYTTYTCTRCGDSYTDNVTQALGHNYVPSVVSPKCTEGGYTLYTCSRCGSEYRSGSTEASGHNDVERSFPATCTEGGYTLHECSRCGDSYRDNVSQPLGHNYETAEVPASCTEGGKTVFHCQVCGYEKSESDGTLPTGHDYTNYVVREATCTEEGLRKSVCDTCGYTYETRITAIGHNYEISDVQTSNGNTRRTYTCSVCGDHYTQELGNQYDEVTNYVEYLFEQYRPYMIWVFLATASVWSIAIGVAIIIAHKNEDKEKAKKMLVNYVVGMVIIFAILVAAPFLVRGIAALVT